jgi:bifunctional DNA-binding transcriptional regulator/antitoxin component of YhaV-PrlF toxin-antitoxin module
MLSKKQMDSLTRGLPTKAAKIRALGDRGVEVAPIARYLRISYQHAYNVLKRSGIEDKNDSRSAWDKSAPSKTTLDAAGRIAIPPAILASWEVEEGEELLVRLEDDGLRVFTRKAGLRAAQEIVRKYLRPGESLVAELIAERRREAAAENE